MKENMRGYHVVIPHKYTVLGDSCPINFVSIKYMKASRGLLFSGESVQYIEQMLLRVMRWKRCEFNVDKSGGKSEGERNRTEGRKIRGMIS